MRGRPSPGLRPPSPRFAGRGALAVSMPSALFPAWRGEEPALSERSESKGAAKRRMRGAEEWSFSFECQVHVEIRPAVAERQRRQGRRLHDRAQRGAVEGAVAADGL